MKKYILFISAAILAVGCQTYKPLSFDLHNELNSWQNDNHIEENSKNMNLDEAVKLALQLNPELIAQVKRTLGITTSEEFAGLWQDPSLGINATDYKGESSWLRAGSLGLSIPINGVLAVEKKLAKQNSLTAEQELKATRYAVVKELHDNWYKWSALKQQVALFTNYSQQITRVAKTVELLAKNGEIDTAEANILLINKLETSAQLHRLKDELERTKWQVFQTIGLNSSAQINLIQQLNCQMTAQKFDLELLLQQNPEVMIAQAKLIEADLEYQIEIRRQYPDLEISAGYESDVGERSIPLGLSFTLPLWNRNQLAVNNSAAKRDVTAQECKAIAIAKTFELQAKLSALKSANRYCDSLSDEIMPKIEASMQQLEKRLKVGEVEVLVLNELLERSLATKQKLIETKLTESLLINDIEKNLIIIE